MILFHNQNHVREGGLVCGHGSLPDSVTTARECEECECKGNKEKTNESTHTFVMPESTQMFVRISSSHLLLLAFVVREIQAKFWFFVGSEDMYRHDFSFSFFAEQRVHDL